MKKTLKSLLGVFLAVFMTVSLMAVPSSAASLSKTSITLTKGYQTTLTVSGTSSSVTWSTGDKSIATVSSKGKVVGKGVGTTYIYAKTGSTTLKCKVKVVAAKITASNSEVELDSAGSTQTVTMTVKGSHSGLTVGSTNKSVATVSWVRPVEWDGNNVKIKITAKGTGTCKVKVYLKNYSSTCYKYINVTVGGGMYEEDPGTDTTTAMTILPASKTVNVQAGAAYELSVYSSNQNNLTYAVSNQAVAKVSAGTVSGYYRTYTITGVSAGSATLRFYDKSNSKTYSDVTITVTGDLKYYEFYTTKPTGTLAATDKTVSFTYNNVTYYMLVPANYDEAYVNTLAAQKFNKYEYYKVYTSTPGQVAYGDTYKYFSNSNSNYTYGTRYVLLPSGYDEARYNTTVAKYNNSYAYNTVYTEYPTVPNSWTDRVTSWTVYDSATGKTVTHYMILQNGIETDETKKIIENDKAANNTYAEYTAYSKMPDNYDAATQKVVMYYNKGVAQYMIVPKNGDVVDCNDAIQKQTGTYEPYVYYSTQPSSASLTAGQKIESTWFGSKFVYYITDPAYESKAGTLAVNTPRGTLS